MQAVDRRRCTTPVLEPVRDDEIEEFIDSRLSTNPTKRVCTVKRMQLDRISKIAHTPIVQECYAGSHRCYVRYHGMMFASLL